MSTNPTPAWAFLDFYLLSASSLQNNVAYSFLNLACQLNLNLSLLSSVSRMLSENLLDSNINNISKLSASQQPHKLLKKSIRSQKLFCHQQLTAHQKMNYQCCTLEYAYKLLEEVALSCPSVVYRR